MIYWGDFISNTPERTLSEKIQSVDYRWDRLFQRYPFNTLFGVNGVDIQDTAQSKMLGNCYFIAGIIAFAERSNRFRKLFVI